MEQNVWRHENVRLIEGGKIVNIHEPGKKRKKKGYTAQMCILYALSDYDKFSILIIFYPMV